jgi:hypothetical protein
VPIPLAVAVALRQPFGDKADHLAQTVSIRRLFNKSPQVQHIVGHR